MENNFLSYTSLIQTLNGESGAESEFILPDYLPNILKLIRTEATSCIRSQSIRGDKAFVDGAVVFKVLYLSENESGIKSIIHQTPFSFSTEIKGGTEMPLLMANSEISYCSARALSPQKLFVKATVNICLNIYEACSIVCLPTEKKCGLEVKNEKAKYSDVVSIEQKLLKISDEIIPEKGAKLGNLLRYDVCFEENDTKLLSNKVIARADMLLKIIYAKESGGIGCIETKVPISQVLQTAELDDKTVCIADFRLSDIKITIKETADAYVINYDAEINITVTCYTNQEYEICVDAFSSAKKTKCITKPIEAQSIIKVNECVDIRESIDLEGVEDVLDVSVCPSCSSVLCDANQNEITCQGVITLGIVYRDNGNDICGMEKTIPYEVKFLLPNPPEGLKSDTKLIIKNYSFNFSDGKLELRINGIFMGILIIKKGYNSVTDVELSDDIVGESQQIILYYAGKGDKVWDIAKRYNASPESIMKNNNIEGDELLVDKMIYISR